MSWINGTTYPPAGSLGTFGLDGGLQGLSPLGKGAFSAAGAGLASLGQSMQPANTLQQQQNPLSMGANGLAEGLRLGALANKGPQQGAFSQQGGGSGGSFDLKSLQNMLGQGIAADPPKSPTDYANFMLKPFGMINSIAGTDFSLGDILG